MAPPRHVPVPHLPAHKPSTSGVPRARSVACSPALGRSDVSVPSLFERLAVDVLKKCDVAGAGRLLRTSWDEAWHLMERAVARGHAFKEVVVPALAVLGGEPPLAPPEPLRCAAQR